MTDFVVLARVRRPQGRWGELRVDVLTDFPEHIGQLRTAVLELPGGQRRRVDIESVRFVRDGAVIKTTAAGTIDEAAAMKGAELLVPRCDAWPLSPGHYYHFDLVGCDVRGKDGQKIGAVVGVKDAGAPLLEVSAVETGREILIPFSTGICYRIEPEHGEIWVDPPEGLLDLNAEEDDRS